MNKTFFVDKDETIIDNSRYPEIRECFRDLSAIGIDG